MRFATSCISLAEHTTGGFGFGAGDTGLFCGDAGAGLEELASELEAAALDDEDDCNFARRFNRI